MEREKKKKDENKEKNKKEEEKIHGRKLKRSEKGKEAILDQ